MVQPSDQFPWNLYPDAVLSSITIVRLRGWNCLNRACSCLSVSGRKSRDRFGTSAVHWSNLVQSSRHALSGTSRLHGECAAALVTPGQLEIHAKIAVQVGLRAVEIKIADRNAPKIPA